MASDSDVLAPRRSAHGASRRPDFDASAAALAAVLVGWAVLYFRLAALRHDRFGTFGFDLGIHDQAVWLLSRARDPFITLRGIDVFGHHFTPIYWLFAPVYWFGGGVRFLLFAQLAGQVLGAGALYLLAIDLLGRRARWLAALVGGAFVVHPSSGWFVWEFFHPDVMAIGPLLMAYRAARTGRWRQFAIWSAVAMACKEDMFLAVAMIGLVVVVPQRRRLGLVVFVGALAGYFLVLKGLLAWRTGWAPSIFEDHYQPFADSQVGVLVHFANPAHWLQGWRWFTNSDHLAYYRALFIPAGLVLPLIGWRGFAIGLPVLFGNVASGAGFPFTFDPRFHYSAIVLAAIFLGVVEAIAMVAGRLDARPGGATPIAFVLVGAVLVACAIGGAVDYGNGPGSDDFRSGVWPLASNESVPALLFGTLHDDGRPDVVAKRHALAHVPAGAPVAALYNLDAHLTHRAHVYEWPNPWVPVNWGVGASGTRQQDPGGVEYIVFSRAEAFGFPSSRSANQSQEYELFQQLLAHEFRIVFDEDDVVVAHRVAAAGCLEVPSGLFDRLGVWYRDPHAAPPTTDAIRACPRRPR